MATEIDSLFISLGLDVSKFDAAQQKVVNRLREVDDRGQRTAKQMQHGADVIGEGFNKAKGAILEFGLAALSINGVKDFVVSMTTSTAELGRSSQRLGMSARDLQTWGAMMKTVGGTAADAQNAFQGLEGGLARLRFGDTAVLQPLAYLHAQNAVNLQTGQVDWFKMADDLKRSVATIGMQPTLQLAHQLGIDDKFFMLLIQGGDAVRALHQKFYALSGVTRDNVKDAQDLQEKWAQLEQQSARTGQAIYHNMVPALKATLDATNQVLGNINGTSADPTKNPYNYKVTTTHGLFGGGATERTYMGPDYYKSNPAWPGYHDARSSAGSIGLPRNLRNNNPGNIEYGPFARAHGATSSDGRFAIFPSMQSGVDAQLALIGTDVGNGYNTLAKLIGHWSPASENGAANTSAYIRQVSKATGIAPNAPLDPTQYTRVAWAMERHEAGTTVETHIQNLNVHTKATDANGIAKDMHSALQQNALINYGVAGVS